MKFRIDKYLLSKTEELAFITVKEDAEFKLEGYTLPKDGLNVPIKNEVLVKGIKENTAQEGLNSMSIADAMIYIIGIDPQFRYNDEYKKFLKALEKNVKFDAKSYMGYMSRKYFEIGEVTDALIYVKALITLYPDDIQGLYNYAIVCQELATQYQKDYDAKIIAYVLMKSTYEKCVDFLRIVDDDETRTKYIVPKVDFDKIATESLVIVNLQNNPFTEYTSILEFSVNGVIPHDDLYSYIKIMNMYKRYISIRITFYDLEQYHETKHIELKERLQFDRVKLNDLLNKEIIKMQKFIGE